MSPSFGDEADIAYAAFTRASRELHLPHGFKKVLTKQPFPDFDRNAYL